MCSIRTRLLRMQSLDLALQIMAVPFCLVVLAELILIGRAKVVATHADKMVLRVWLRDRPHEVVRHRLDRHALSRLNRD